jgi:predicted dehydrogenase
VKPTKMEESISRRRFVSGVSVAAATIAVAPYVLAQSKNPEPRKSDKLMRIGVVGGNFGSSFFWHEHPNCKVTAVCELRDDRMKTLQETYHCDVTYKDYSRMLKDPNVDAVGLFTPVPLHVPMAVEALKAGKHVISAVPAGYSEEECVELLEMVKKTGLLYMMAETSFYRRQIITCRQLAAEKKFGEILYSESEYHHPGLEVLWQDENGKPTWRHGYPPMHYPTHCTGMLVPVTGERLVEVTAVGWGNNDEAIKGNPYNNPFYNETAFFKTSGGHCTRVAIYWKIASGGTERGQFLGTEMSYYMERPGNVPNTIARLENNQVFQNRYQESRIVTAPYQESNHYELLPEPLHHDSGHGGSHTFITHEFTMAVLEKRQPAVNVYEALAYTIPGIYAHKSALEGGKTYKIPDYGRG